MKDFVSRTNRSAKWLKDNILNNSNLIKKLDVERMEDLSIIQLLKVIAGFSKQQG